MGVRCKLGNNFVQVPAFKRANYERLRNEVEEVDWQTLWLGNERHDLMRDSDVQGNSDEITYNGLVEAAIVQNRHIPYR